MIFVRRRCQRIAVLVAMLAIALAAQSLHSQGAASSAQTTKDGSAASAEEVAGFPRDGQSLIVRSLKASEINWRIAENYAWQEMRIFRQLDKSGSVKKQESKTFDVIMIDGKEYERLIREDGEPLAPDKERKEQEKLDKEVAKLQNESPSQRQKRLKKDKEEKEEREAMFRAIPRAYHLKIVGEELVEGREAWVIHATPRADFKPFNRPSSWLSKMEGTLWIDKSALIWLRAEVETLDTLTFGWVLARVGKGSTMLFEQQLVNGEVWVPRRAEVNFDARLALMKKLRGSAETLFSEYKRFSSDSRIVSTSLVDDEQ